MSELDAPRLPSSPDQPPKSVLTDPVLDKAMALLACVPLLFVLFTNLHSGRLDIPRIVLVTHILLQVGPMFVRRPAIRISRDPRYWILSFVTTYWAFAAAALGQPGKVLVPFWISDGLSLLSLVVLAYARLSLGRNIGVLPAQRRLVTHGAYRYVRHPIYSGTFLVYIGVVLSSYTPFNLALSVIGCVLYMIKSLVEERFLSTDPAYQHYMREVRWRWLPGIA